MTSIEAPTSDAWDLRAAPAARIVAMPTHQLDIHDLELCFEEGIFLRLNGEQFPRESRQAHIGRDPFKQRPDSAQTFRGDDPEFGRVATDAIGELGPIADQALA